jgi:antitoxin component of RelBE/YafQ-DinJ toxin-antitoxin module
MFTPMTQTKTVSTRIDNEVHTLFSDYCNQQGKTMSQILHLFIDDIVSQNKDSIDSSQCSIDSDEETVSKEIPKFSQDEQPRDILKEVMKILDEKNKKKIIHSVETSFRENIDHMKMEIEALERKINKKLEEDRMKKGMSCFENSNF